MSIAAESTFDRNTWAQFYAQRHLNTDEAVQRIVYLPTNASPREIRFLEVNSMVSEMTPLEPIDFGVDTGGTDAHRLYVLDVTPTQWNAIKNDQIALPEGWTLDGMQELATR